MAWAGPVLLHRIRSSSGARGWAMTWVTVQGGGQGTDSRTGGWERSSGSRAGSVLFLSPGRWFWGGLGDCGVRIQLRLWLRFWTEMVLAGWRVCVGLSPGGGPTACGRLLLHVYTQKQTSEKTEHKNKDVYRSSYTPVPWGGFFSVPSTLSSSSTWARPRLRPLHTHTDCKHSDGALRGHH